MAGLHGSFSSLPSGLTSLLAPREEFQEEEVWGGVRVPKGSTSLKIRKSKSAPSTQIPRSSSSGGGSSDGIRIPPPREPTKPMDVPDWNKILKEEAPKKKWWDEDDDVFACYGDDDDFSGRKSHRPPPPPDEDEDDDEEMLPPHELLARRRKRNGPVAYSMCEGIGRTLKGRDLVNVRNAVLSMTGFIE